VRRRWIVLASVLGLLGILGAVAVALVFAGGGPSPIEAFVPANATAFAEVRLDAPGDQKVALAQLALRVPGAGRPPSTGDDIARGVTSMIGTAVGGPTELDPSAPAVGPWLGGSMGMSVMLPSDGGAPRDLAIFAVRDAAAAQAWTTAYTARLGGRAGVAVRVVDGGGSKPSVLLAGADADVGAAVSASNGGGLAAADGFRAARASLGGDEMARAYLDVTGLRSWLAAGGATLAGWTPERASTADTLLAGAPAWLAVRVRAEADALLVQVAHARSGGPGIASEDPLASQLPADTIAAIGLRDAGGFVAGWLGALRTTGEGPALDQVDGALAGLGGIDGVLGQIGAADLIATWDGQHLAGGLVLRSTKSAATLQLLDSVRALARLANAPLSDEPHGDTTITVAALPGAPELPLLGTPAIEVAMRGDLVVIGVGQGFAASVLDVAAGSSLGDSPSYRRAVERAGGPGAASCFADVQAVRGVAARLMPSPTAAASSGPSPQASPGSSFRPDAIVAALEGLGCSARQSGSARTITLALTVR
jgi:hypothetical protein